MVIPSGAIRKKRIINAFLAAGAGSRSTAKTCQCGREHSIKPPALTARRETRKPSTHEIMLP